MQSSNLVRLLLLSMLFAVGWSVVSAAGEADITVSASGLGSTRDAAMREMKRNAVEQAMGVLVRSNTLVEGFEIKRNKVLTQSEGFVKRINNLHEQRDGVGGWQLQAQVSVSSDSIKNEMMALKMLQIDAQMPRIAVVANEQLNGRDKGFALTATEAMRLLREKQFNIVDPAQIRKLRNASFDRALFANQGKSLPTLHIDLAADFFVVIKTECNSAPIMEGVRLETHQVVASIKVLNAGTGAVLAAETVTSQAAHISEQVGCAKAIDAAISQVFNDKLIDQMVAALSDVQNNGMTIHLTVRAGLSSYRLFKQFRSMVTDLEGVVSMNKRGWNRGEGSAEFDLLFRGTADELADALDALLSNKADHQHLIEIEDVKRNRLDVSFLKEEKK